VPPGALKTVPDDLAAASKNAGGELFELSLHQDAAVFVNPSAWLDIDLFADVEK
jgi:hypothetical protein